MKKTGAILIGSSVALCISAAGLALTSITPSADAARPTPQNTTMAQYSATEQIPPELSERLSPEMVELSEPYPNGVNPPTLGDLIPWAVGATVVYDDDSSIVYNSPEDNPVTAQAMRDSSSPGEDEISQVNVVTAPGDVAVLKAINWECAWISEYVTATEADDTTRADTAVTEIRKFPDLDAIQKYNPEVGEAHRSSIIPQVLDEDLGFAKYWLNASCSAN